MQRWRYSMELVQIQFFLAYRSFLVFVLFRWPVVTFLSACCRAGMPSSVTRKILRIRGIYPPCPLIQQDVTVEIRYGGIRPTTVFRCLSFLSRLAVRYFLVLMIRRLSFISHHSVCSFLVLSNIVPFSLCWDDWSFGRAVSCWDGQLFDGRSCCAVLRWPVFTFSYWWDS